MPHAPWPKNWYARAMRTLPLALALLASCSHTIRDPELLARAEPITYLGADFTKASIHDPLFDPGTFTAARVQRWSDLVTATLRAALPGLTVATDRCDAANAAFVPEARFFDPRPWRPPDIDPASLEKRIAPWVAPEESGLGLVVSLERVNAQDRLSALVILFERSTGRIGLAERVRATLEGHDPFAAAANAYEFGAREESSLIGGEYRPHFEALGRRVAELLAAELGA
jgi:hypothetical protein